MTRITKGRRSARFKSFQHSFFDRRSRKRFFRRLWICRINARRRQNGLKYHSSQSILNRKILTQLQLYDTKKL